jgi:2-amino-4-hydroxy-6-hydroxymethyldihydropteridine diphosphokinase
MAMTSYAVALGSNRRHGSHGAPAQVLAAACEELAKRSLRLERRSAIRSTPAFGPAGRGFANAAIVVATDLDPPQLLALLKSVERGFGRRGGRRWGPRVLDLDIILWSGGAWEQPALVIPHPEFRSRPFVLEPLAEIAPAWRDPISGASIRQLRHRLERRSPVDPHPART